jgi:hypothetical protein
VNEVRATGIEEKCRMICGEGRNVTSLDLCHLVINAWRMRGQKQGIVEAEAESGERSV